MHTHTCVYTYICVFILVVHDLFDDISKVFGGTLPRRRRNAYKSTTGLHNITLSYCRVFKISAYLKKYLSFPGKKVRQFEKPNANWRLIKVVLLAVPYIKRRRLRRGRKDNGESPIKMNDTANVARS